MPKTKRSLRDEVKSLELSLMQQMDKYAELSAALGFAGTFWGDPLADHEEVVAEAKRLRALGGG